jgi:deoxyribonuclease V
VSGRASLVGRDAEPAILARALAAVDAGGTRAAGKRSAYLDESALGLRLRRMWPRSAAELVESQRALAAARPSPWLPPAAPLAIGACAACFGRGETGAGAAGDPAWAAAAVLRNRRVLAQSAVAGEAGAPYAAGMLALREGALLEAAVAALDVVPDVLLVDATGRDHPRRAGLALQLGAQLALPTVGVTHRPLLARGAWPEEARGASAPLSLEGERVGAWLRTRRGARPVAVHAGWRTDVEAAIAVVLAATRGHRTPEPLRRARRIARMERAGG